jgi:thiaminase/transcriptional activator TenA
MYVSEEYKALAHRARSLANGLAEKAGADEVARMEEAYLTSLRYEYLFWDMAYKLEAWPV